MSTSVIPLPLDPTETGGHRDNGPAPDTEV